LFFTDLISPISKGSLGESSTWSFSHRTLVFLRDYLNHPESPNLNLNEEGSAYSVNLFTRGTGEIANVGSLPSIDYAIFLINGVKFHIGQLFHLFDETVFMRNLHEFYGEPFQITETNRLWYIQFQVILALGKAVTVQMKEGSPAPPGSDLFARAVSMMPDSAVLFTDAPTAIELLCAVALYFQLIDMRNTAYIYVSSR
jgi:proline utilization trans-activator